MQINITTIENGEYVTKWVDGESFNLFPYDFTFGIHERIGLEGFTVSELRAGGALGHGDTKHSAVIDAVENINRMGSEELFERIKLLQTRIRKTA